MTNKLIKVDRVRSVAEAVAVEELGAGLVGVALDEDPRFADRRVVSADLAAEIGRSLSRAKFVVELDFREDPAKPFAGRNCSGPTSSSRSPARSRRTRCGPR